MNALLKTTSFFCFFTLIFLQNIFAQAPLPGIFAISETSKIPLQDAVARTADGSFTSISDENGFISLQLLPRGQEKLLVSAMGFEEKELIISEAMKQGERITIQLKMKATSLQEVTIKA